MPGASQESSSQHAGQKSGDEQIGFVSVFSVFGTVRLGEAGRQEARMKKFSRMPKSESGSLGGGSGTGSSNYIGKVFAVGRYQVTVEELIAEGNGSICLGHAYNEVANLLVKFIRAP